MCTEYVLSREKRAVRKGYLLDELKYSMKKVDIKIHVFTNACKPLFLRRIFGISKINHGEHISKLFIKVEILIFCLRLVFSSFPEMPGVRGYF